MSNSFRILYFHHYIFTTVLEACPIPRFFVWSLKYWPDGKFWAANKKGLVRGFRAMEKGIIWRIGDR